MELAEAAWPDVETLAADTSLAVLPVGSTEQHGPHGPLGTDRIAAEAVTTRAVDHADPAVAVAPAVPVGISEEHRHFAGSLWVSPDTFRAYVGDVLTSLASHGFDRIVVVNGHGGNIDAIGEVCRRLTRDGHGRLVGFTWFEAVDESAPAMGHAGPRETALLRHVSPDLVREDRVEAAAAAAADRWGDWVDGTNLAVDVSEFSENGVVGDPREGDAEAGGRLLQAASTSLAGLLEALAARD
ncbi:MAG: creatininase family protein [Halobacteriaceae archaeon]